MDFEGKSLFFIGDSITEGGGFFTYLRAHFQKTGRKIFLHNKGIPGFTTKLTKTSIEEDLSLYTPDYAVISFGCNDVMPCLYDSRCELTEKWQALRLQRKEEYKEGIVYLTRVLRERGITPIFCSPFCVNENIVESEYIETVADNKEKGGIDYGFYTKKTFSAINEALKELREYICDYATQNGYAFWDLFTQTLACTNGDCFEQDGLHYTREGHKQIAKCMLLNMYGEQLEEVVFDESLLRIAEREKDERAYYFVKYNIMKEHYAQLSDVELIDFTRKWLDENGHIWGLNERRAEGFFRFTPNHKENQKDLLALIKNA